MKKDTSKQAMALAGLVFEARKKSKLTTAQVGKAVGVTASTISSIENCLTNPSLALMVRLSTFLKFDLGRLNDDRALKVRQEHFDRKTALKSAINGWRKQIQEAKRELERL